MSSSSRPGPPRRAPMRMRSMSYSCAKLWVCWVWPLSRAQSSTTWSRRVIATTCCARPTRSAPGQPTPATGKAARATLCRPLPHDHGLGTRRARLRRRALRPRTPPSGLQVGRYGRQPPCHRRARTRSLRRARRDSPACRRLHRVWRRDRAPRRRRPARHGRLLPRHWALLLLRHGPRRDIGEVCPPGSTTFISGTSISPSTGG